VDGVDASAEPLDVPGWACRSLPAPDELPAANKAKHRIATGRYRGVMGEGLRSE
jgi:hypothetical protein